MSKWKSESALILRYAGSGVFNTLLGFAVICGLMLLGMSPFFANIGGYLVGFWVGFAMSKRFVFRSNGHFVLESMRYLVAFALCLTLNLLVLKLAISDAQWPALAAQVLAACTYTAAMYVMTRFYVYRRIA